MQKLALPVDAPLRGGRLRLGAASSDKHYWVAASVGGAIPADVWITLPLLDIDGRRRVRRDPLRAAPRGGPRAVQLLAASPAPVP